MGKTSQATRVSAAKRKLDGEKARTQLLFLVEDNPGLSSYNITQRLNWTSGRVAHHLKVLFNRGEIRYESVRANPHPKKLVYAVSWKEMINWDSIPVDKRPPELRKS